MARDDVVKVAMGILLNTDDAHKDLIDLREKLEDLVKDFEKSLAELGRTKKNSPEGTIIRNAREIMETVREQLDVEIKKFEDQGDEISVRILKGLKQGLMPKELREAVGSLKKGEIHKHFQEAGNSLGDSLAEGIKETLGDLTDEKFFMPEGIQNKAALLKAAGLSHSSTGIRQEILGQKGLNRRVSGPARTILETIFGAGGSGPPSPDAGLAGLLQGQGGPGIVRPPGASKVQQQLTQSAEVYQRILTQIDTTVMKLGGSFDDLDDDLK